MKDKLSLTIFFTACLVLHSFWLSACTVNQSEQIQQTKEQLILMDKNATVYVMKDGTDLDVEALNIGLDNFRQLSYIDEQGIKQTGPTARLWINYREDTSQNQRIQVHSGQKITVATYTIQILNIQQNKPTNPPPPGGSKSFVQLAISSSDDTQP